MTNNQQPNQTKITNKTMKSYGVPPKFATTGKQLCEVCNKGINSVIYNGNIRDGAYGGIKNSAMIYECNNCGIQRLSEQYCMPDHYYTSGKYRQKLEESLNDYEALVEQDKMNHFTLGCIFPKSLRGKFILDVGCGVGSFLDSVKNISHVQIGVEPCNLYLDSLSKRGYKVYSSLSDVAIEHKGLIDDAFSIHVIEHVKNPRKFLEEIKDLIKHSEGKVWISTPNRNDILMTLLKDKFYQFFYRTQHRWYFDESSLTKCAELAGFKVERVHFVHRYGMANMLYWLRDIKPTGSMNMDGIDNMADSLWKSYLENNKQSDSIYMELSVADCD